MPQPIYRFQGGNSGKAQSRNGGRQVPKDPPPPVRQSTFGPLPYEEDEVSFGSVKHIRSEMTPHTVERAPQKQASPLASAPLRHVILTPPSKTVQDAAPPTPAPQAQTEPIEHIADTGASNAYACVAAQDIEPEPGVTKLPLKNTRGKGEIFTPDGSVRLGINGYYMLTWNLIFAQESDARQVSLGHNDHNVHLTGANGNTQYAGQQVGWFFADDDLCLRLSAENEKDYAKKHRVDHAELTVIQLA